MSKPKTVKALNLQDGDRIEGGFRVKGKPRRKGQEVHVDVVTPQGGEGGLAFRADSLVELEEEA